MSCVGGRGLATCLQAARDANTDSLATDETRDLCGITVLRISQQDEVRRVVVVGV